MTDRQSDNREPERSEARAAHEAFLAAQTEPAGDDGQLAHDPALHHTADGGPEVIGSPQPLGITVTDETEVSGADTSAFAPLGTGKGRLGDRVFAGIAAGSGAFIVILIALVALFLLIKAIPSVADDKANFFTSREWSVNGSSLRFGIVDMLWTTVLSSVFAMLLAVPVAVGIALFITQYAPARLARPVAFTVDLLAAIPSIVYGVWGIYVFAPKLGGVRNFLQSALGWIPLFHKGISDPGTVFAAGIVLAVMILPIVTAISREVFERTPLANKEAAWALGSTKWEMIRLAVLPYGRPGVISGAMLGLGRALGETIAVTLILSTPGVGAPFSASLFSGGETFASKIANAAAEFNDPKQTGAYIAAGLVLFVLTFAVNAAARVVVNRRKEFS